MTVNHGVPGSSPGEGARVDKPSAMMAFSLSISQLG
jgi:hypothetical protein